MSDPFTVLMPMAIAITLLVVLCVAMAYRQEDYIGIRSDLKRLGTEV